MMAVSLFQGPVYTRMRTNKSFYVYELFAHRKCQYLRTTFMKMLTIKKNEHLKMILSASWCRKRLEKIIHNQSRVSLLELVRSPSIAERAFLWNVWLHDLILGLYDMGSNHSGRFYIVIALVWTLSTVWKWSSEPNLRCFLLKNARHQCGRG